MSDERNPKALERYYPKVIKKAARSTLEFSKAQLFVDALIAVFITILGYFAGIVTSTASTILVIVIGYLAAMIVTGLINLVRAPAFLHREQVEENARLRSQLPGAAARQLPAQPAQPEARSNIVCEVAGFTEVEIDDYDIVRRGSNHIAIVAEFVNQPVTGRHIASENYVLARITFYDANGKRCQRVTHGTWLEEQWRSVDFDVGDTRYLVLAAQLTDAEEFQPEADALRAIQNNHESVERFVAPDYLYLPPTTSRAEVHIFSASNGAIVGEFSFMFDLTIPEPSVTILDR